MELPFYDDDIKVMELYTLKRENKYKSLWYISWGFCEQPMFWVREIEEQKVTFFKIFWHVLLLLMIEELMLVIVTRQNTFKFIGSLSSALIEISVRVQLTFKVFTPSLRIKGWAFFISNWVQVQLLFTCFSLNSVWRTKRGEAI